MSAFPPPALISPTSDEVAHLKTLAGFMIGSILGDLVGRCGEEVAVEVLAQFTTQDYVARLVELQRGPELDDLLVHAWQIWDGAGGI